MPRMISDPNTYFAGVNADVPETAGLSAVVAQDAMQRGIPIIGPVMGKLLELLAMTGGAHRVLELGAAVGYSTAFLARAMRSSGGHVTAVDMNPAHCRAAKHNLDQAGVLPWCTVLCADARTLPLQCCEFDMIFLDVDQRYYTELEPVCHQLLRMGGMLVADNTAFVDAVGFNAQMANPERWFSVNLFALLPGHAPEHDGLCLALKMNNTKRYLK